MKKLSILLLTLILAGLSVIVLFYPDSNRNDNEEYFIGTIVLEMVNEDGSKISGFEDSALAKEGIDDAINKINPYFLTRRLNEIGYDSIINLKETRKGLKVSNKQQYLTIEITNFDGQYVEKMGNQLVLRLTEHSGSAPYFRLIVDKPITIERKPTIAAFFDRQLGEEITVSIFVIIWVGILGIILMREIKLSENNYDSK